MILHFCIDFGTSFLAARAARYLHWRLIHHYAIQSDQQITSNFLTQASRRSHEIRQPPTSLCTASNLLVYNLQLLHIISNFLKVAMVIMVAMVMVVVVVMVVAVVVVVVVNRTGQDRTGQDWTGHTDI